MPTPEEREESKREVRAELAIIHAEKYNLGDESAAKVRDALSPMAIKREGLVSEFNEVVAAGTAEENIEPAKALLKQLVSTRTGIEKIRKSQKDFSLQYGRFVDAAAKAETAPVVQMEERIKEITEYHANIEKERRLKLHNERRALMLTQDPDDNEQDYSRYTEEHFEKEYESACWLKERRDKKEAEEKAAAEAAEKAEQERLKAEKAEQERIQKENERLRKEAEERDKKEAAERAKREAAEAKENAARDKERKAAEEKLSAERAKREKVEAEAKAKAEAEKAEKEAELAREKDTKNKKRVHNEALNSIASLGWEISDEQAKELVTAIAKGKIKNVSISY